MPARMTEMDFCYLALLVVIGIWTPINWPTCLNLIESIFAELATTHSKTATLPVSSENRLNTFQMVLLTNSDGGLIRPFWSSA